MNENKFGAKNDEKIGNITFTVSIYAYCMKIRMP